MPPSQASSKTGCITKNVMNSAIEDSTMLGGVWFSPSAERSIENTMTKRVNEVITTSRPGAIDSTVITAISCRIRPDSVARSSEPCGASLSASPIAESRPDPASCASPGPAQNPSTASSSTATPGRRATGSGRRIPHSSDT